jgi:hypothetical protein
VIPVLVTDPAFVAQGAPSFQTQAGEPSGIQTMATFVDPDGALDDYTAVIDWGEGLGTSTATVQAAPSGSGYVVVGSHTYASSAWGTYTATITITNKDSGETRVVTTRVEVMAGNAYQISAAPLTDDPDPQPHAIDLRLR